MNDTADTSAATPDNVQQLLAAEQARIGAELQGLDGGTDPFVVAVRATRMPMIVTNARLPDNPVVFANDAFCRLSGYRREEIVGRNCRFLQGPGTDPGIVRRIREAVAAARSLEIDIRNYRKDGEPFWNRLLVAPVHDSAGVLAYFIASQVDVTVERERLAGLESRNAALLAEVNDRLRSQEESEARLRLATHAGRLGVWELDLRTNRLLASQTCKENFGRMAGASFTYADLLAALHPEDRPRMQAAMVQGIEAGDEYGVEYRVQRHDGRLGWLELRMQVIRGPDGKPLLISGTSYDITGRKQTEVRNTALLELDARCQVLEDPVDLAFAAAEVLGQTLEVSRAGYGTIDPVSETISIDRDWNAPGIQSLAGQLRFRDYGSYIEDLLRGETVIFADADKDPRTAADAAALKAISAQAVINMPVTEHAGVVAMLYLNHAEAREWSSEDVAFMRQVSLRTRMAVQRRHAEQELRQLAASLEAQVAARTEALMAAEAALRQSQKMEAVGQLTGGLAHDFNNLLTGISGSLEMLQARVAQGRVTEVGRYVAAAQGAASRAAALTHRLLAFSRRQTLEPRISDINRLVAGMEDLVRRTVGPAIQVEVVAHAGLWNTLVDPSQLENALLNLCINSRDAMPEGGRITIETGNRWLDEQTARPHELQPGQYVSLCVGDTGTGMTPEVIAKAFDPFFTTKPIGQGTGLGLSMIYGFARQSGGEVRIQSRPGRGSRVCLHLPRHLGKAAEVAEAAAPGLTAPLQGAMGRTVLVVDDEPTIRMLAADVLAELGYTAIGVEHGAAGLEVLRSTARIDLMVTDVGLPGGLNGRQLADAGRALRPGLKVLFITGYAENAVLSHGHLEPGMQVMTKPFAMEMLAGRIRELLSPDPAPRA